MLRIMSPRRTPRSDFALVALDTLSSGASRRMGDAGMRPVRWGCVPTGILWRGWRRRGAHGRESRRGGGRHAQRRGSQNVRAVVVDEPGGLERLRVAEVPEPRPRAGEV